MSRTQIAGGVVGDTFCGSYVQTDYLFPLNALCVKCGPLCVDDLKCHTIEVDHLTVNEEIKIYCPIVVINENFVWINIGPVVVPNDPVPVPIGPVIVVPPGNDVSGTWIARIDLAGTGTTIANFCHYNMIIHFTRDVNVNPHTTTIIDMHVYHEIQSGTLLPPNAPIITAVGEVTGLRLYVDQNVEPINFVGYAMLTGAQPSV